MIKKYTAPALWIIAFQIVGSAIGYFTASNMDWYDTLTKSPLTPPDIAFPIAWTSLYIMLALCGWKVWDGFSLPNGKTVFLLFWAVMPLNWAWSFIFFEFQMIAAGFWWIIAMNISMIAFIAVAWANNRVAALLMVPTLLWCSFAAYLNYSIWILN